MHCKVVLMDLEYATDKKLSYRTTWCAMLVNSCYVSRGRRYGS